MKKVLTGFIVFFLFSTLLEAGQKITLNTSLGDIQVELFEKVAPKACENFITHAKNGYYNETIFHRVIKGFMVQGGDPTGTGRGGNSIWKKEFKDEFKPNITFDRAGLLAMANRGRNTNGSQFFITVAPTPWLNGRHTIFGEVIDGFKTLSKIENTQTKNDRPLEDIKILKITID